MLFLLMQITILSPDHSVSVGVSNPWTEYARILPSKVPLPTTWTEHEQEFLIGTSLEVGDTFQIKYFLSFALEFYLQLLVRTECQDDSSEP